MAAYQCRSRPVLFWDIQKLDLCIKFVEQPVYSGGGGIPVSDVEGHRRNLVVPRLEDEFHHVLPERSVSLKFFLVEKLVQGGVVREGLVACLHAKDVSRLVTGK